MPRSLSEPWTHDKGLAAQLHGRLRLLRDLCRAFLLGRLDHVANHGVDGSRLSPELARLPEVANLPGLGCVRANATRLHAGRRPRYRFAQTIVTRRVVELGLAPHRAPFVSGTSG